MLVLAFTFPAGRYHATPWDRHVNEGAVGWPPEPWRLLRALIATWHHKVKHGGRHSEPTLMSLIESLAKEPPQYTLPPANHSHTRHYMPQWKAGDTSLVFDAFTAVARDEPLYVTWPNLELPSGEAALLDDLLAVIGYLGRAESWVEACRVERALEPNCVPSEEAIDKDTGELRGEVITLLAPLPADEYGSVRDRFIGDRRAAKRLGSALPDNLFAALSVETADLRKQGWNQPPAARKVSYLRPLDALRPKRLPQKEAAPGFTTVRYLLTGKPLPRAEDSVRVGELLRMAVLSQAGHDIPPMLSGHDLPRGHRHQHAFYLPWDANNDGHIDRVLLYVPAGMGAMERRIVEKVRRIWSRDGGEWRLVLEGVGGAEVSGALGVTARMWQSVTPYLHPWHVKKSLTIEDQIKRECRERGFPDIVGFERLPAIRINGRERRPVHFHRFRSKRGLTQPDTHGSFWRIEFSHPVQGPLALGFGCHFGLGMFRAVTPDEGST